MNKLLQFTFVFILFTVSTYPQWFWQNPLPQGHSLSGVSFSDANNGTAVGEYGTIVRTTNGGANWISQSVTTSDLSGVSFSDANNGTAVGDYGTILRTNTGGFTAIEDNLAAIVPDGFLLKQNYPNPFNPATTIKYQIPEISFVTLKVYDVLGNEIAILVNEEKSVGNYEVEFYGTGIVSGIYFYRLQAGSFVETKKMVLMK